MDQIQPPAARIPNLLDHLQTEEATKNALVMPFIAALGYNVFDPTEVMPEYTADVGTKKGEKVDYAILRDGEPIIIFECKTAKADLDQAHASQLFRYFATLPTRIAILTNGVVYRFYADLEEENKMDSRPFLELNMLDIRSRKMRELKKLSKAAFDVGTMLSAASDLKYSKAIRDLFVQQLEGEPADDFIRFFATNVYTGHMTKKVKDRFRDLVPQALNHYIRDSVNDRLQSALDVGKDPAPVEPEVDLEGVEAGDPDIETTAEEMEAFHIVRAILAGLTDPTRVIMRDTKSYCGVLLDDNNRKPICRLRFNASSKKYLGLFDADKNEERVAIETTTEIYQYADRLKAMVAIYDG